MNIKTYELRGGPADGQLNAYDGVNRFLYFGTCPVIDSLDLDKADDTLLPRPIEYVYEFMGDHFEYRGARGSRDR